MISKKKNNQRHKGFWLGRILLHKGTSPDSIRIKAVDLPDLLSWSTSAASLWEHINSKKHIHKHLLFFNYFEFCCLELWISQEILKDNNGPKEECKLQMSFIPSFLWPDTWSNHLWYPHEYEWILFRATHPDPALWPRQFGLIKV